MRPRATLALLLCLASGLVAPARADDWDAPWTQLVRRRAAQWGAALAADERFEKVGPVPRNYRRATRIGVRGVLYEKTG